MARETCTVNGAVNRTNNLLDLTIDYRLVSGVTREHEQELPRSELDRVLAALRSAGWQLESQCANPDGIWYHETYMFCRDMPEPE